MFEIWHRKTENSMYCISIHPSCSGHLIAGLFEYVWTFVTTEIIGLKKSIFMNAAKLMNYRRIKSSCHLHVNYLSDQCFYWRRKQRDCFQQRNAWRSLRVYYFKKHCRLNDARQEVFLRCYFLLKDGQTGFNYKKKKNR